MVALSVLIGSIAWLTSGDDEPIVADRNESESGDNGISPAKSKAGATSASPAAVPGSTHSVPAPEPPVRFAFAWKPPVIDQRVAIPEPAPWTVDELPETLATPETELGLKQVAIDGPAIAFELNGLTWDAAYFEAAGHLALTNDEHGVVVYDIDDIVTGKSVEPIKTWKTDGLPTALCLKQSGTKATFYSSGDATASIQMHDAASFDDQGSIEIPDGVVVRQMTSPSSPDNPWLFAVYYKGTKKHPKEAVTRINTATNTPSPQIQQRGERLPSRFLEPSDVATSPNGDIVYFRQSGQNRHVGTWQADKDPDDPSAALDVRQLKLAKNYGYVPGPFGQQVGLGSGMFDASLRMLSMQMPFEPKAWFRTRPLLAGYHDGQLVIGSAQKAVKYASLALPTDWYTQKRRPFGFRYDPRQRFPTVSSPNSPFERTIADDKRGLVIAIFNKHLVVLAMAKVPVPDFPRMIPVNRPTTFYVDHETEFPMYGLRDDLIVRFPFLTATDVKSKALTVLRGDADDDPKIDKHTFRWKPTINHLGNRFVKLNCELPGTAPDAIRGSVWWWNLQVEHLSANVPFYVDGIATHESGTQFIAWGVDDKQGSPVVAIVDTVTGNVVEQIAVEEPVLSAAIDDQAIYVCYDRARPMRPGTQGRRDHKVPTEIVRFDRRSGKSTHHVPIGQHGWYLRSMAGKFLAVETAGKGLRRFQLPDMQPSDSLRPKSRFVFGEFKDGWLWDGIVWDRQMQTPTLLLMPEQFGPVPNRLFETNTTMVKAGTDGYVQAIPSGHAPGLWTDGNLINPAVVPCFDYAGTIALWASPRFPVIDLYADSLVSPAKKPVEYPLIRGQRYNFRHGEPMMKTMLASGPGFVLTAMLGKVYGIPSADLFPDVTPFGFLPLQSTMTLNRSGATELTYAAPGATSYSLTLFVGPERSFPNSSISAKSANGAFSIDLQSNPALMQAAMDQSQARSLEAAKLRLQQRTESFTQLVGRAPAGLPIIVRATVTATHPDGQRTGLFHSYLVEVPLSEFDR